MFTHSHTSLYILFICVLRREHRSLYVHAYVGQRAAVGVDRVSR